MENKMERTNLHHQNCWVSLHQTPRARIAPSFFSSGWESLLPAATQYRNPYLDTPANNRPTYYIDILCLARILISFYTSLRGAKKSNRRQTIISFPPLGRELKEGVFPTSIQASQSRPIM